MNVLGVDPGIREKRSERAKKASVTRARYQELRVREVARRVIANRQTGPAEHCDICGKAHCLVCGRALTDSVSIERGIGPACWGYVLDTAELIKAKQAASVGAAEQSETTS